MERPRQLKANEIRVGSIVGMWNGDAVGQLEVIEDRGNIGHRGEHIYRVRNGDGLEFEAPLDDMVDPTPPPKPTRRSRASTKRVARAK